MKPILSCRDSVYGGFDDALKHLPDAGIMAMEASRPAAADLPNLVKRAQRAGMTIATVGAPVNLADEESLRAYEALLDASADSGVPKVFTSIGAGDRDAEDPEILNTLRGLARKAEGLELVICMETHRPFGHNALRAERTIEAVGSPALRVNFDTANIYYYNKNVDGIAELKQIVKYVASVHLKDTAGGFEDGNFPVFGEGIVDFKSTFDLCLGTGIEGPYTLELEGPLTSGKSVAERHAAVKACVAYLRTMGAA